MTDRQEARLTDLFTEREALVLEDRFGGISPLLAALATHPAPAKALATMVDITVDEAAARLEALRVFDLPDTEPIDADLVPPMGVLAPEPTAPSEQPEPADGEGKDEEVSP